jgi:hypothetical protein
MVHCYFQGAISAHTMAGDSPAFLLRDTPVIGVGKAYQVNSRKILPVSENARIAVKTAVVCGALVGYHKYEWADLMRGDGEIENLNHFWGENVII